MSSEGDARFDRFATGLLVGLAGVLAAVSAVQPDFWWLLRAGKDIWSTGRVPLVDHYSYTAAGRAWPNHEWLWEAMVYPVHLVGGMPLVAVMTSAIVAGTLWVLLRVTAATGYVVPLVLALTVPLLSVSWTMRPQVTSLLLFAVTMLLLSGERYRWIPLLFVLWANTHAQVVMGGVLLVTATLVAVLRWLRNRTLDERTRLRRLVLTTTVSGLATLLNPLGPRLWSYVLDANARPGQHAIDEWHSAFEVNAATVWFWTLAAVVFAASLRRRDRLGAWRANVMVAAASAMAPLAVLAVRNIPFFVVAVVPLLMTVLEFRTRQPIGTVPRARLVTTVSGVLALAAVVTAWTTAPRSLGWRPVSPGLAAAVRACPGHLFNGYVTGSAIIWWVPDVKVFVDNRQDPYPAEIIHSLFGLTQTHYRSVFEKYDVACAVTGTQNQLARFLAHDGWRATYLDQTESVWVRPSSPLPRAATDTE